MPIRLTHFTSIIAGLALTVVPALAKTGGTLEAVRARGHLVCGVSNGVPGFAAADSQGRWAGLDVDICRALAAAIFLDDSKAKFRPLEPGEGETALRQGEIDILTRPADQTLELQAHGGLDFVGVSFFDAQALLVRKSIGIDSVMQLSGVRICLADQPRLRTGLLLFFGQRKIPVDVRPFGRQSEAVAAYQDHKCDALSQDASRLPGLREALRDTPDYVQLTTVLAVHPMGPVVRQGDEAWRTLAQWTLFAMVAAEEAGLDQAEIRKPPSARSGQAAQLLSLEADLGPQLGLSPNWGEAIIAKSGNYGEMFERNLGPGSAADLERGLNNLWSAGGLMVAPRVR